MSGADGRDGAQPGGETRVAIANALVGLFRETYGRGPTKAKTYVLDDLVLCVLRGSGTPIDQTLVDAGRDDLSRQIHRAVQGATESRYVETVERLTRRRVKSFMSETDPARGISVQCFVMEGQTSSPDESSPDSSSPDPS